MRTGRYELPTLDGGNWAVCLYNNAITLTALHGADLEDVDFEHAFTITIWAA
jgi:hypothetical protein